MKFISYLKLPNGYFLDQRSLEAMETKMTNKGLGIFHPLQKFPETLKTVADWFSILVCRPVGRITFFICINTLTKVALVAEPLEPV